MIWSSFAGKIIMTLFISMVPVLELRGAIPIGTASGLPLSAAVAASVIGNLIPIPFIILFIRKIFDWLRTRNDKWSTIVTRLETKAEQKSESVRKYVFFGLAIFVAIPLPGTGAWTGALIASVMNMPLKKAFPSIALGVAGAAVIVSFVTYGAGALLSGGRLAP